MDDRQAKSRERSRQWRVRNREKHRANVAAWKAANPEKVRERGRRRLVRKREASVLRRAARAAEREANREVTSEARRARRRARYGATAEHDREKERERGRAWRLAHPGYMGAAVRAWRAANPEKRRADRAARKLRKRAATIEALMKLQRSRCAYCRDRLVAGQFHIDHIIPRSRGGSNARSNLQLACEGCNGAKGSKLPEDFARQQGMLI